MKHGGDNMKQLIFVTLLADGLMYLNSADAVDESYRGLHWMERGVVFAETLSGVHVNTYTGNLLIHRHLMRVGSRGIPFDFWIAYNSDHRRIVSPLGPGWSFSYHIRYVRDAGGNVLILWGDGRVDRFVPGAGGGYQAPPGVEIVLTETDDSLFMTTKWGLTMRFDDPHHRKVTAIEDPNGNTLSLEYNDRHFPRRIMLPDGRAYLFDYDADEPGRLTGLEALHGGRAVTIFDYERGRLVGIEDPLGNVERFAYDDDNMIVAITDRRGNVGEIAYAAADPDSGGAPLPQKVSKAGAVTTIEFDGETRTTTTTGPNSNAWKHVYSPEGMLAEIVDPFGESSIFAWDENRNLASHTDRTGATTVRTYDETGNMLTWTDALGNTNRFTYDPSFNRMLSATDRNGNTWIHEYDERGNRTRTIDPLGNELTRQFDEFGRLTILTDREGHAYALEYDERGNPTSITDPLGNQTVYEYDDGSRLTKVIDANGNVTEHVYDALDRLISVVGADGNTVSMSYDAAGYPATRTNALGAVTTFEYDAAGRLVSITNPLGDSQQRAYDPAGNLIRLTDYRGNDWIQEFDVLNRVIRRENPIGSQWHYTYDAEGRLVTHTTATGQITVHAYDALGRMIGRTFADGTTATFAYDHAGNLIAASDANSDYTYEYDKLNRITRHAYNHLEKDIRYEYDANGRITTKIGPEGDLVRYQFDAAGRRVGVTIGERASGSTTTTAAAGGTSGKQTTFAYDPVGNRIAEYRSTGLETRTTFDANNRLLAIEHARVEGDVILQSFAYKRDDAGRVIRTTRENGDVYQYAYDGLNRLVSEEFVPSADDAFGQSMRSGFDANGNRTVVTNRFGPEEEWVIGYVYDDANQLVAEEWGEGTDGIVFVNNANGNRIEEDRGYQLDHFEYDPRNRPVIISNNFAEVSINWDIFDNPIQVVENNEEKNFVFSDETPIAEYDAAGAPASEMAQVCLFSFLIDSNRYHAHAGGNLPRGVFPGLPLTLITDSNAQIVAKRSFRSNGDEIWEEGVLPASIDPWVNADGGAVYRSKSSRLTFYGGAAYDSARRRYLNPLVELGNSEPNASGAMYGAIREMPSTALHRPALVHSAVAGSARAAPFNAVSGPMVRKILPPTAPGALAAMGLRGRRDNTWSSSTFTDTSASGVTYTFTSTLNIGNRNAATVSIQFYDLDGGMLPASTSSTVAAGQQWFVSTATGFDDFAGAPTRLEESTPTGFDYFAGAPEFKW